VSEIQTEGTEPALRARGLGYRFPDGAWAFREVDYSLKAGGIAVLAGRNGAGKTFLAKQLAGLLEPTEGSVLVSGRDLKKVSGARAELVGYVFQDARLQIVGETVFDDLLFGPTNLGMAPELTRARALSAMAACGLTERKDSFVHQLSGGEQRRLAIAGVLAMMPPVLILDEPFANLDLAGVRSVLEIVHDVAGKGTAVLVVTHEIEKVLGIAQHFAVMDAGRIVLSGGPAEVLGQGIERFGLRDPFRGVAALEELSWLA
jgi:biotin transport system ATP-binding protein